ncbi:hypothetical protein G6F32_016910 [Rhizopus arrhizus]|nr:hypothetical protein G6F32_016910 [Rhizopus arrhizus]
MLVSPEGSWGRSASRPRGLPAGEARWRRIRPDRAPVSMPPGARAPVDGSQRTGNRRCVSCGPMPGPGPSAASLLRGGGGVAAPARCVRPWR